MHPSMAKLVYFDAQNCLLGQLDAITALNHVPSNGGSNRVDNVQSSVFAKVNLTLFVYFNSSSKWKYFFL